MKRSLQYYIDKFNKIHNYAYDYSLAHKTFQNVRSKIEIICPKHKAFILSVNHHQRRKCPQCVKDDIRTDWFKWLEKIISIHGNLYDYSLVQQSLVKSVKSKIPIICSQHGVFYQPIDKHINAKHKCPKCRGLYKTKQDWIDLATLAHNAKYSYDIDFLPNSPKGRDKVKIICPIHGEFIQKICDHIYNKTGCPSCDPIRSRKSWEYYLNQFNKRHNGRYKYEERYSFENTQDRIPITCEKHGIFYQSISLHRMGRGCPTCKSSKGELYIIDFLKSKNIIFQKQKTFPTLFGPKGRRLRVDFFLPHHNLIIEYDGRQHFVPVGLWGGVAGLEEIKKRDIIKNEFCLNNGIELLRISYLDDIGHIMSKRFQNISL